MTIRADIVALGRTARAQGVQQQMNPYCMPSAVVKAAQSNDLRDEEIRWRHAEWWDQGWRGQHD